MKPASSKTTALSTLLVEFGEVLAGPSPIVESADEGKPSKWAAFRKAVREQTTVVGALILRDMRTRFGRTHLGFVIAILWPLSHMGFIMLGYLLANRVAPIGNSSTMFVATGVLPYILFFYPARLMMISALIARPLLHFPVVKFTDIMMARICLEVVSAAAILVIFSLVLAMSGVDIMPLHPENVAIGIAVTIFMGIGFGCFNMVMCIIVKPWALISLLLMIFSYATAGALVLPGMLSQQTRYLLSYNAVYQSIALLRSGYYDGFYDENIDPWYVFGLGLLGLIAGFLCERIMRGRILET